MVNIKYLFLLIIPVLIISFENNSSDITFINVSVTTAEVYEYHTGLSGDEEGAGILKQAKHYKISKFIRDSTTQWVAVYKYKAQNNYVGEDTVELELLTGSDGTGPPTTSEIVRI